MNVLSASPIRRLLKSLAILLVFAGALLVNSVQHGQLIVSPAFAGSCDYDDNLSDTAQTFIGRCCRGGINGEFPGEYYNVTLDTIRSEAQKSVGQAKKAYKLLNDSRFRK